MGWIWFVFREECHIYFFLNNKKKPSRKGREEKRYLQLEMNFLGITHSNSFLTIEPLIL